MERAGSRQSSEGGFTLVEVMIATLVLMIGLLSVAYGVGVGLVVVQNSNEDTIAREKAREAMEDVFTARDTGGITFDQICNVGSGSGCVFINGFEPMYTPGPDGIVNTADDGQAPFPPGSGCTVAPCVEALDTPGPNGILGTSQDVFIPLSVPNDLVHSTYIRQVAVTIVSTSPPLKQITVTIQYTTSSGGQGTQGHLTRTVVVNAVISPFV